MVAYNFKKEFAPLVASGVKTQTLRLPRKGGRHAMPGESVQLYTGMRTNKCKKILEIDPSCNRRSAVKIISPTTVLCDGVEVADLQQFAKADGFPSWAEMYQFFAQQYGAGGGLDLILIGWDVQRQQLNFLA